MQRALLTWAFHRFGARYPRLVIALQFQVALLIVAGGVWLLDLYVERQRAQFWRIFVVSEVAVRSRTRWRSRSSGGCSRPRTRGCAATARRARR